MDYVIHGILQARILEWVAFPSPEDLLNPRTEPRSPILQADSLPTELSGKPMGYGRGIVICLSYENPLGGFKKEGI